MNTVKIKTFCALISIPTLISAQSIPIGSLINEKSNIKFETGLNINQIKEKARSEDKFIFVDCFATWCRPCKFMEEVVFTRQSVATYVNSKFISVRLQMDTTVGDNSQIKEWYPIAHQLASDYKISVLPTYLFFAPNGKIIHKDIGVKSESDFLTLVKNVQNESCQYYSKLVDYQTGKKDLETLKFLATYAKKLGEDDFAIKVAADCLENYLYKVPEKKLLTKGTIEFLRTFIQSSKEKGFKLFLKYPEAIDSIMGSKYYARNKLDYIITKEVINPALREASYTNGAEPNWDKIVAAITNKYNVEYAYRLLLRAKENWYLDNKQWDRLHEVYVERFKKYGVEKYVDGVDENIDGATNNMAWNIFQYSNDEKTIKQATKWMYLIVKNDTLDDLYEWKIDTYANLLYKGGKVKDAIEQENLALKIALKKNEHRDMTREIQALQAALNKMKKGEPTW